MRCNNANAIIYSIINFARVTSRGMSELEQKRINKDAPSVVFSFFFCTSHGKASKESSCLKEQIILQSADLKIGDCNAREAYRMNRPLIPGAI